MPTVIRKGECTMGVEMNIIKDYGVIADHNGLMLKLMYISWANMPPKYDLRAWKDGKPIKGIVLEESEIKQLGEIINNHLAEEFAIREKIKLLDDIALEKAGGKPKKTTTKKTKTGTVLEVLNVEEKPKEEPKNIYEKFSQMFEKYRESQPEKRRPAYESTHNIILEHMKSVMETSEEYNNNGMHPCKDSHKMMNYVMEKAFENHDATTDYEEAKALICSWADEYIGLTSDVEEWKKAEEKKKRDEAKRKKREAEKEQVMKSLEPKALEELNADKKYLEADDKKKASMLKSKLTTLYNAFIRKEDSEEITEEGDEE